MQINESILRAAIQNGLPFKTACDAAGTDPVMCTVWMTKAGKIDEFIALKRSGLSALLNDAGDAAKAKDWEAWAKKAGKIKAPLNLGYFQQECSLKELTPPFFYANYLNYHYLDLPYVFGFRSELEFNTWVQKNKGIAIALLSKKRKDG